MWEKAPTRAVLDFIRTTRAGRCKREKEYEEVEAQTNERWRMNDRRMERDSERDKREEGGGGGIIEGD